MKAIFILMGFVFIYSYSFSQPGFGNEHIINDYTSEVYDIKSGDIDGDGHKDILTFQMSSTQVYKGLGYGNFGTPETLINVGSSSADKMFVCDFDNDGYIDVLYQIGDGLMLYPNDGNGNFSGSSLVLSDGNSKFYLGDVYGDGDIDVIQAKNNYWNDNNFYVNTYENNGTGSLSFSQQIYSTSGTGPSYFDLFIDDSDKDNDLDMVISFTNVWQDYHDRYFSFANNTGSGFNLYDLNSLLDISPYNFYGSVLSTEFNGDGDIDIYFGEWGSSKVYENDGNFNFYESHEILDHYITNLQFFDVDLDGDNDIVYHSDSKLYWTANDGNGYFDGETLIRDEYLVTYPIDADGDTDIDLFAYHQNKLFWIENISSMGYNFDFEMCDNDSMFFAGGWIYDEGSYIDSLVDINGMDSIVVYNITLLASPPVFFITGSTEVNPNSTEPYLYSVPENSDVEYSWEVVNGNIIESPSNNSINVQWSGNSVDGFVNVTSGHIVPNGCSSNASIEISIGDQGVGEIYNLNVFVCPIPAKDKIFIKRAKGLMLSMFTAHGSLLFQKEVPNNDFPIDVSSFEKGIYYLEFSSGKHSFGKKVIID